MNWSRNPTSTVFFEEWKWQSELIFVLTGHEEIYVFA